MKDPNVLAGRDDNAAVYKLSDELSMIQTIDYITPVVDDPYQFGMIAAANALSDIYAMGGRPVTALNIIGFPNQSLPLSIMEDIIRGGADKAAEAGVTIVGGHSITDSSPKYGLAVTGLANPAQLVGKDGAKPGDRLILTKPLGVGVITTGIDHQLVNEDQVAKVTNIMLALNRRASEIMLEVGVNACTDVTGYGLLGHLREIVVASGVGARVNASAVPVLPGTEKLVRDGAVPGGTHNNYRYLRSTVQWDPALPDEMKLILCDPQTSGGLLMVVPRGKVDRLLAALRKDPDVVVVEEIGEISAERDLIDVTA